METTFAFTGTLSIPREAAFQIVLKNGGIPQKRVTKATMYLVQGELNHFPSRKISTALRYNLQNRDNPIQVLTEKQFFRMMKIST